MPCGGGKRMRAPAGRTCPHGKENTLMFKAKLFNFRDSQNYLKRYGISPEKHFDKLHEQYGKDIAVEMIDRNMMRIWEDQMKEGKKGSFEQCSTAECPFPT